MDFAETILYDAVGQTLAPAEVANPCSDEALVCADENSDALRETFILRKTSLDQEQWDNFLSPDAKASNMDDSAREGSALLGRKSGLSQVNPQPYQNMTKVLIWGGVGWGGVGWGGVGWGGVAGE